MGMDRRRFLQLAALGAAGAACSRGAGRDVVEPPEGTAGRRDLSILNWSEYIDPTEDGVPGTVDRFQIEHPGVNVFYDEGYEGNVEALATVFEPTLGNGDPSGYDLAMPTYWLAQRMLDRGWIEEVPVELVPNRVNLDPAFLGMPWDRGARFHLPWQVGITGIAYDPARVGGEVRTVAQLFDQELAGRVAFIGEMREAVGLAMLANGDDPTRADVDTAGAAMDRIEAHAADITAFTFNEFSDLLRSGEVAAAMAWSGDIVQLQAERPDLRFVVPEEGGIRWFDTMVRLRGAANAYDAARFMDFVYDPEQAARITAWVQYISPVLGVREELVRQGNGELAENPILFPDDATARRLYTWDWRGTLAEEDELEARFNRVAGL